MKSISNMNSWLLEKTNNSRVNQIKQINTIRNYKMLNLYMLLIGKKNNSISTIPIHLNPREKDDCLLNRKFQSLLAGRDYDIAVTQ